MQRALNRQAEIYALFLFQKPQLDDHKECVTDLD